MATTEERGRSHHHGRGWHRRTHSKPKAHWSSIQFPEWPITGLRHEQDMIATTLSCSLFPYAHLRLDGNRQPSWQFHLQTFTWTPFKTIQIGGHHYFLWKQLPHFSYVLSEWVLPFICPVCPVTQLQWVNSGSDTTRDGAAYKELRHFSFGWTINL